MSVTELVKIFPICRQPVHLNDSVLLDRNLSVQRGPTCQLLVWMSVLLGSCWDSGCQGFCWGFVQCERQESSFSPLPAAIQFHQRCLLKMWSFLQCDFWPLCQISGACKRMHVCPAFSFILLISITAFVQQHADLTTALEYNLKSVT